MNLKMFLVAAGMAAAMCSSAATTNETSSAASTNSVKRSARAVRTVKASPRVVGTKIGDLAWASDVQSVDAKVTLLEEWAVGDDIALRVEDAGETNAVMSVVYTNKVMYSSKVSESNTLERAKEYTDAKYSLATNDTASRISTLAWGNTRSGGAPSPADVLYVEKKSLTITGGGNFSFIESSTGGYWVMTASAGSGWTMESLANAQDPSVPSTLTTYDSEGQPVMQITSTSSREVFAIAGAEMFGPKVEDIGGNDVVTMIFPVNVSSHPTLLYTHDLEGGDESFKEASAANFPEYIASSDWDGDTGAWTNVTTMVGKPGRGFFKGKITQAGTSYTKYLKPIGVSRIIINNKTYEMSVENIGGKNLIVLTQVYD